MAKIEITRKNEWINRFRNYRIYLDGQKIGTISNNETREFEVPSGQHTLTAKIDWCGSKTHSFSANEVERKEFSFSGFRYASYLIRITGGIIALHFILINLFEIDFLIWLIIPAFLFLGYYFTFGRNDYLIIEESS
jgi:hypothetical protein